MRRNIFKVFTLIFLKTLTSTYYGQRQNSFYYPEKHLNKLKRVINLGEYEIKATASYVRYMQIETPISFKDDVKSILRSFSAHNNIPMTGEGSLEF